MNLRIVIVYLKVEQYLLQLFINNRILELVILK